MTFEKVEKMVKLYPKFVSKIEKLLDRGRDNWIISHIADVVSSKAKKISSQQYLHYFFTLEHIRKTTDEIKNGYW